MPIQMNYNLDLDKVSKWNMMFATPSSKASLVYLQEVGDFYAGPNYYTTREGFSSFLIKVTLAGSGELEYRRQRYITSPGQFYWLDCRKWQDYRTNAESGSWHVMWVHFFGANSQYYYDSFMTLNNNSPVCQLPHDSAVYQIMLSLLSLDNSGKNQQAVDLTASNLLTQLMCECTLAAMRPQHTDNIPTTLQEVRLFLKQHYQQKLTLEELGNQFNINPFYLQKQFKRHFGQSPSEYQIYLRMTNAKELMRTTRKSISEIAYAVGIDNLGYFTRLFKKSEGMTPQEYRRLWGVIDPRKF